MLVTLSNSNDSTAKQVVVHGAVMEKEFLEPGQGCPLMFR